MELNLLKLHDRSEEIHHLMNYIGDQNHEIFEYQFNSLLSKFSIFSIILILFVIFIGFFQFFYLNKKISDRKRI